LDNGVPVLAAVGVLFGLAFGGFLGVDTGVFEISSRYFAAPRLGVDGALIVEEI
jgi:hypothetical protein